MTARIAGDGPAVRRHRDRESGRIASGTGAEGTPDEDMSEATRDADWRAIFGHEEPYEQQVDGIETAIETGRANGYTVLEGACGTGKTMIALTAGLSLVRDRETDYERVLVLTSVKQQLRQFEADLRTINGHLPTDWDPISGLTLVGKADVCPYEREGAGGFADGRVYDRCETLRSDTRTLSTEDGPTAPGALVDRARRQQIGLEDGAAGAGAADYLETAGEPSPYPRSMPTYDEGDAGGETEFCPFYAQYLEDLPEGEDADPVEAVPFDLTEAGLISPEDLVARSMIAGTCPHSMMGAALGHAEVVIANYYHAFDPITVSAFTGALLDGSTFVVCDEAHMLEPRVRALVSDGVGDETLRQAITECSRVLAPIYAGGGTADGGSTDGVGGDRTGPNEGSRRVATGERTVDAELVRAELADATVSIEDVERTRAFLEDLRAELDRRVSAHLDRTEPGWRDRLAKLTDMELPLRDPETPEPDAITEWAREVGYGELDWAKAESVGATVARILNTAEDEERQRAAPAVGRLLGAWYRRDHTSHFREIELERTWNDDEPVDSWRRAYRARLALHNCVPSEAIGSRLAEFGGGILMSATLEPMDAFAEVTGLEHLERAEGRPVVTRRYGLHFPEENRESFAVATPKFTYENRGPTPLDDEGTSSTRPGDSPTPAGTEAPERDEATARHERVREHYAAAMTSVARVPGNVLVGMPNYAEARWAAGVLRERVEKPILLDESSTDATTESLKGDFFAGEGKVLVTSLRGTLTEGVDYRGDRLSAAAVCGVPLVNTASPRTRAVRRAYEDAFGDGFEYALLIPAVRKARQAVGRVIRGPDEVGIRVLVDERYARDSWDSVRPYLPEREEFQPVSPDMLELGLERFLGR